MKKQNLLYLIISIMIFGIVSAQAENILLNPGFETGGGEAVPDNWTVVQASWWITDPQYVYSGTGSVQCNGWGEWGEVKQTYESAMLANQTVTATVWAMIWSDAVISNGWNGAVLSIMETGFTAPLATTNFVNSTSEKGVWHKGIVIADLYPDSDSIEILLQCAAVPDWTYCQTPVYFDNASLEVVIPEPGMVLSLLGLLFLRRRRE